MIQASLEAEEIKDVRGGGDLPHLLQEKIPQPGQQMVRVRGELKWRQLHIVEEVGKVLVEGEEGLGPQVLVAPGREFLLKWCAAPLPLKGRSGNKNTTPNLNVMGQQNFIDPPLGRDLRDYPLRLIVSIGSHLDLPLHCGTELGDGGFNRDLLSPARLLGRRADRAFLEHILFGPHLIA